jgi:hypothetical protein
MEDMVKRLRVSRHAESEEVLAFWREHGKQWAQQEASHEDIKKLVTVLQSSLSAGEAAESVALSQLQAIWTAGFSDSASAYGWNEMNDELPPAALLAFVRGVEEAWAEVKDKV